MSMVIPGRSGSLISSPVNSRRIPLGRPVVPDEYNMMSPAGSSASRPDGIAATASSYASNPATVPSIISRCSQPGM